MAKKKLKKALMMAAPMLALAMMGRKGRASTNADAIKKMTTNAAMRGINPQKMMSANELAVDLMDPNLNTGDGLGILDMKKGGRVKRKTKKGGRAVRKANRSKKK